MKIDKYKNMSLDVAWTECLKMWKWIAETYKEIKGNVSRLKGRYLIDTGLDKKRIRSNCFFCEYAKQQQKEDLTCCMCCPGRLIDPNFHCRRKEYDYSRQPVKFYDKLLELHKVYLKSKESGHSKDYDELAEENNHLKEILFICGEIAVADYDDRIVGIVADTLEEDFILSQERIKEVLKGIEDRRRKKHGNV